MNDIQQQIDRLQGEKIQVMQQAHYQVGVRDGKIAVLQELVAAQQAAPDQEQPAPEEQ